MTGECCSILFVGAVTAETAQLRDSLRARAARCDTAPLDVAIDLLHSDADSSWDVFLIDERSSTGGLPSLLAARNRLNGTAPGVIVLASGDGLSSSAAETAAFTRLPVERCNAALVLNVARPFADRRRLIAALAQSDARYERLLRSVTDYTYTVRMEQGRPVASRHSPGCIAVTGYAPEEYEADPHLWYRMVYESDRAAVVALSDRVCAGQEPPPLEHRIVHKDGSIRWIKNTPVPRRDAEGRLTSWDGLVTDITARKTAEERLQLEFLRLERAKQEWEVTFDSLADPIFIHDRECRILRANRAYREIADRPFSDLIGKRFFDIFPRIDASVINAWLEQQPAGDPRPYFVEEFGVPSLRRIFRGRVFPLPDADGRILSCIQVLEDVTDMKRAEESMRQEMEVSANLLTLAETATGTMDADKLMDQVLTCCARMLGADAFLSYDWDPASRTLRPCQQAMLPAGSIPLFRTDGTAAGDLGRMALNVRRPCVARRSERSSDGADRFLLVQPGSASMPLVTERPYPWLPDGELFVAIPLFGKTDCLGLLLAVYRRPRELSERDLRILEGISREVSLALDEAFLYRTALERSMELAHKMETLKVIHEIDRSILSTLEPQVILETAIRNIARIIPCDSAEAMLTGEDRDILIRVAGSAAAVPTCLRRESTAAADVLTTFRPAYTPDLASAGPLLPEEARLLAAGMRSLFRVPLAAKGSAVGVLSVASARPACFTPENVTSLEQLAGQIGVAFENTRLLSDLKELLIGTVKSLSYAIDAKSSWTAGHSERVTRYALLLGRELGMSDATLRDLELAGLLHDVGKLGTFDAILDKKTMLTPEEFEIIKRHPLHGAEMLAPIKQMQQIIPAVRHHHERFDGTGYPDGLKGGAIPDLARMLAVADAFDSMTGWRPYRKTFDVVEAVEELRRCSGTQFDPVLTDRFISLVRKSGLRVDA